MFTLQLHPRKTTIIYFLTFIVTISIGLAQSLIEDTGSPNTYRIIYPANFSGATPPSGFMVTFKALNDNTGSSTLKLNSYTDYLIKKNGSTDLGFNDIKANNFITVIFDGTNNWWQMLSVPATPIGNVTSGGNTGFIPRFVNANNILNSPIQTDGSWVSIGTTPQNNYLFRVDQNISNFPAIYGQNSFTDGVGIWGNSNNNSPNAVGVRGVATGQGRAIFADNSDATGYALATNGRAYFSGGNVGIGAPNPTSQLHIIREGNNATFNLQTNHDPASNGSDLFLSRARSTIAAPGLLQNGDRIGGLIFRGYDGGGYFTGAAIEAQTAETWASGGKRGTSFVFNTVNLSSITPTEKMRITANGNVGIGTNAPLSKLGVNDNVSIGAAYANIAAPTNGMIVEGNVGIGFATPSTPLYVRSPAVIATAEQIAVFEVADGSGSNVQIGNFSIANAIMEPLIRGDMIGSNNSFVIQGITNNDAAGGPMVLIDAKFTSSALTTKPLFGIANNSALRMIMLANGNVGFGTTSPLSRIGVNGNVSIGAGYANIAAPANGMIVEAVVGIGTSSPSTKLDVRGTNLTTTTAAKENIFQVAATDNTTPLRMVMGVKTDATATNRYAFIEALDTGPQNLVLQPINGNVLIGTATGLTSDRVTAVSNLQNTIFSTNSLVATDAAAIRGESTAPTGEVTAIYGKAISTTQFASAIYGLSAATTGQNYGVYGRNNGTGQFSAGVRGLSGAATGEVYGVQGVTSSTNPLSAAINGIASNGSLAGLFDSNVFVTSFVGIGTISGSNANVRLAIRNGHIQISQTTAPAIANNNATGGALTNATDVAGKISFTSTAAIGAKVTITFNRPFTVAPVVVITPTNAAAAAAMNAQQIFVTSAINNFIINAGVAAAAGPLTFNYIVLVTQ